MPNQASDGDAARAAAWGLIDMAIPAECLPGVAGNLAVLAGHVAIVRSARVAPETEAAEVFQA